MNCAILPGMESDQSIWKSWANRLKKWGIADWTAQVMESFGPLAILGAQAIYITKPLVGPFINYQHLEAAAHLFEQPTAFQEFIILLREELTPCLPQEE